MARAYSYARTSRKMPDECGRFGKEHRTMILIPGETRVLVRPVGCEPFTGVYEGRGKRPFEVLVRDDRLDVIDSWCFECIEPVPDRATDALRELVDSLEGCVGVIDAILLPALYGQPSMQQNRVRQAISRAKDVLS